MFASRFCGAPDFCDGLLNRAGVFGIDPVLYRRAQLSMAKLTQFLLVLQQTQAGAHDFTDIIEAPGFELLMNTRKN